MVATNEAEAYEKYYENFGGDNIKLKQDEDCLDTWFSSWLWPFEVFKGLSDPGNKEVKYYYPTNTLVTAPEIIFFWVARMIMMSTHFMKNEDGTPQMPFKTVYVHGLVRDANGNPLAEGDSITLIYNGKILTTHQRLTDKPLTFYIKIARDSPNELVMYAENLGSIPPNTALMVVHDGDNRYEVRISSDLQKSGTIRFIHKPTAKAP